ncbi:hypothetical protein, partial [Salmonella enterica]|uniref:hypothetical protein n=1 Tax=Salmonella enterica TaxID=28901 RepID=UPI00398C72BF
MKGRARRIVGGEEGWVGIGRQKVEGGETVRQGTQQAERVVNALNTEARRAC